MSATELTAIDSRLRAALLWDVPSLLAHDDGGARQWRRALELDFAELGELDEDDLLSVAAHAVAAELTRDAGRARGLRLALAGAGPAGVLFGHLIGLGLSAHAAADAAALAETAELVADLRDDDLRARLSLRLVEFAHLRGQDDVARLAAAGAVEGSVPDSALGLAARRWAAYYRVDVRDFDPSARHCAPPDPLLALPWVQRSALCAAAALAADEVQQDLAGVWEAGVRVGRAPFDDLLAAHVQAEWCGALDLREPLRKLLVADLIAHPGHHSPDQLRWGVAIWAASSWGRRKIAAICRIAPHLGPGHADDLLGTVARDPNAGDEAAAEVAAAVWDLLDDAGADALLHWVVALEVPRHRHAQQVIGRLLRRRPATWAEVFDDADARTRGWMVGALEPADLDAVAPELLERLAAHAGAHPAGIPYAIGSAIRYAATGVAAGDAALLDPETTLALLGWDPDSVTPEATERVVARQAAAARVQLERAAAGPAVLTPVDSGELLGRLAAHLPRPAEAIAVLLETAAHRASTARWQLGALEGLAALRAAGRLTADDLQQVHDLELRPGRRFLGERISATALRADRLRVLAPDIAAADVAWLAGRARGDDPAARLVAIATLGAMDGDETLTVDWALANGLFDTDDSVVSAALAAIRRRGLPSGAGPLAVVRDRLRELAREAPSSVRRDVVELVAERPELGLGGLLQAAHRDASWLVRDAAQRARTPAR